MWWKIIALVYAFCYLAAIFDPSFYQTPFRAVGFVLSIGGLIGLLVFAFKKRFLSQRYWRLFAVTYVGYTLAAFLLGAQTVIASHGFWGLAGAAATSVVFQFPIVFALWRLSTGTAPTVAQPFNETVAL
jgi:hypothetical protein